MPQEIVYTIEDAAKNRSTTSHKVADGGTLAAYIEYVQSFASLIGTILRGVIRNGELCLEVDISTLTGNAVSPLSDVENIGAFEFVTAQGNRVKLNIPGCPDGVTITDSNDLDPADPQVATIITMMEAGLAGVQPCDVGGDDIVDTLFARENFRSSGARKS